MKRFCTLILGLLIISAFCANVSAAPQLFETEGIFVMGNNDNKEQVRDFAVQDAKRLALEQAGTYLKNAARTATGKITVSDIAAIASNVIRLENIISEETRLHNGVTSLAVKARFSIDSNDLQKKIDDLRQTIRLQPETARMVDLQKRYARLLAENNRLKSELAKTNNPENKEQLLVKIKETDNELAATRWYDRGHEYFDAKNFASAIDAFTKTIAFSPQYVEVYNSRGNCYLAKNQYDLAIDDYSTGIQLNSQYAKLYYNRGASYGNKGEYDLAIADFSDAIRLNPQYIKAYNNRGLSYLIKGQYDLAIADCAKAIKLMPQIANAYAIRALSYYWKGQFVLALADINKALELDPQNEKYLYVRKMINLKILNNLLKDKSDSPFLAQR